MQKQTILTGVRANQNLTIGNYFGAIKPIVDTALAKADDYQVNLFIPDLHSFTTPVDHASLYDQVIHNAKVYAAAGLPLDHQSIFMYRQSYIPAHSELTWILDCFTGFGEMSRMTQFKDKSQSVGSDRTSVGLFNYPVLMAADILLYNASYVPVGEDQTQHLEFTRDIAERLNNQFGQLFTVPKSVKEQHQFFGNDKGLRVKDLVDPSKKMSKSDESGRGVIFLSDTPEAASKKIMGATTDDVAAVHLDHDNQPGISNLLLILSLLRDQPIEQVAAQYEGVERYGDFKKDVASAVSDFLTDFQAKLSVIDAAEIERSLESSEQTVAQQANQTLLRAQQAVGLRPKRVEL